MPGIPDNSAGSSHCRQRDEDQACAPPSGPGAPSPDSQAEYTQAIRPRYPTFFETAWAFGGSPYTLLEGNKMYAIQNEQYDSGDASAKVKGHDTVG